MTRVLKRFSMFFLCFALCMLTGLLVDSVKTEAATKAKVVLQFTDGTQKTWKSGDEKIELGNNKLQYVYFGEYPQTEVKGKKLTKAIKNAEYDENGIAVIKGMKYKRITTSDINSFPYYDSSIDGDMYINNKFDWAGREYAYFRFEPIKWRVLLNKNGTVFLLSEYGLDDRNYNDEEASVTWEDCKLRNWLNNDFLSVAFNSREKKMIRNTKHVNADNTNFGVDGGNATKDKVYLLSYAETLSKKYGFSRDAYESDMARRCAPTDYSKAMGTYTSYNNDAADDLQTNEGKWTGWWMLRSPGAAAERAANVGNTGYVSDIGLFVYGGNDDGMVRPVIKLNVTSVFTK